MHSRRGTCDGFSRLEGPCIGEETVGRWRTLGCHASVARQHVLTGTSGRPTGIPPNRTEHLHDKESRQQQLHNFQVSKKGSRHWAEGWSFHKYDWVTQLLKINLLTVKCGSCEACCETLQRKVYFWGQNRDPNLSNSIFNASECDGMELETSKTLVKHLNTASLAASKKPCCETAPSTNCSYFYWSNLSSWQLQICSQSPGLIDSLSRREGFWFWWRKQRITEGTCGQWGLSLPVRHRQIRQSRIPPRHDSQGGIWKELCTSPSQLEMGFDFVGTGTRPQMSRAVLPLSGLQLLET